MTVSAPEHLRANYASGVATWFALITPAWQGAEAVVALNMQAARAALNENEAAFKGALQTNSPVEFFTQQVSASQQIAAKSLSYSRHLFDIATKTQAAWTEAAQAQATQQERNVKALTEQFSQHAPVGSEAFVAAMHSTFSAFGNAAESIRGMTRQAIEATQNQFEAATATATAK
ncbi:Phasin_2 domain-containing protein [Paraburkholderia tropica]|uniref:TIGR01841 family phasin n=1 Tax=Paraburkholderia tropica TaxID=92647 RepID=UPI001CB3D1F6|nr:TIGR01841 family phasin [Paraburkholderia tropica]CAG9220732.1 Phasin_2 domain-containing protein [Paraburkholderia tropica]